MNDPGEVSGSSLHAAWLKKLRRWVLSMRITSGPDYLVERGPNGSLLKFRFGGGSPVSLSTWKFESPGQDYVMCRRWDGTKVDMSGSPTPIAMPDSLRGTVATERIDSVVWTYTYGSSPNQRRIAVGGGITENQVITPRYLPYELLAGVVSTDPNYGVLGAQKGSTIWAISATTFALDQAAASISLLDLNLAGRAWAAE